MVTRRPAVRSCATAGRPHGGEHFRGNESEGPPPPARGAPGPDRSGHPVRGAIPAGAGSTLCGVRGRTAGEVHPRRRGGTPNQPGTKPVTCWTTPSEIVAQGGFGCQPVGRRRRSMVEAGSTAREVSLHSRDRHSCRPGDVTQRGPPKSQGSHRLAQDRGVKPFGGPQILQLRRHRGDGDLCGHASECEPLRGVLVRRRQRSPVRVPPRGQGCAPPKPVRACGPGIGWSCSRRTPHVVDDLLCDRGRDGGGQGHLPVSDPEKRVCSAPADRGDGEPQPAGRGADTQRATFVRS